MATRHPRAEKIDLCQTPEARADETLPDRLCFSLDGEQWTAFMEALDAPPREVPRLRRLLEEPSAFERPDLD